jgi:hypothetical protein
MNVQAGQDVLMIEALCNRFNHSGEPQMNKDVISQDEEPLGIHFVRHLESVDESLNCWSIAKGTRPTVKPQPNDFSIVE